MAFVEISCRSLVHPKGYKWVDELLKPAVEYNDIGGEGYKWCFPLEENATLFSEFAELHTNRNAIREFANKYGELAADEYGTFKGWLDAIKEMKAAIELWRQLEEMDTDRLKKVAKERYGKKWPVPRARVRNGEEWENVCLSPVEKTNPKIAILAELQNIISDKLRAGSPGENTTVTLEYDKTTKSLRAVVAGGSLFKAIWLQFAAAMDPKKEFIFCQSCNRAIYVAATGRYKDKKFCGDACRQRSSRGQRSRAKELKREKKTLSEIAKELGVTTAKVRDWLKVTKKKS